MPLTQSKMYQIIATWDQEPYFGTYAPHGFWKPEVQFAGNEKFCEGNFIPDQN